MGAGWVAQAVGKKHGPGVSLERLEVVGRGGLAGMQDDEMQASVQNFSCAPMLM